MEEERFIYKQSSPIQEYYDKKNTVICKYLISINIDEERAIKTSEILVLNGFKQIEDLFETTFDDLLLVGLSIPIARRVITNINLRKKSIKGIDREISSRIVTNQKRGNSEPIKIDRKSTTNDNNKLKDEEVQFYFENNQIKDIKGKSSPPTNEEIDWYLKNIIKETKGFLIPNDKFNSIKSVDDLEKFYFDKDSESNLYKQPKPSMTTSSIENQNSLNRELALHATQGNLESFRRVLNRGARIDQKIINTAASSGNLNILEYIEELHNINLLDIYSAAEKNGNVQIIDFCMRRGYKPIPTESLFNKDRQRYNIFKFAIDNYEKYGMLDLLKVRKFVRQACQSGEMHNYLVYSECIGLFSVDFLKETLRMVSKVGNYDIWNHIVAKNQIGLRDQLWSICEGGNVSLLHQAGNRFGRAQLIHNVYQEHKICLENQSFVATYKRLLEKSN